MAKYLVIVESPAKVKTIKKFLGKNYEVAASNGHVRDLPKSQLGVDVEHDFEPKYITIRGKGDILANLRKEVKKADKVYLATDPDREGEAISWHLSKALKLEGKDVNRISFNEITQSAVKASLKQPRDIDMNLVNAQQARRILDRMVGYKISPLLWAKVKRGLSAGRVQSVALRIICDREEEINSFIPEEYWSLNGEFLVDGEKKPLEAKFYGTDKKMDIHNKAEMDAILENLKEWIKPLFKKPQYDLVWNRDYSLTQDRFSVNTLGGRVKLPYFAEWMSKYFDRSIYRFGTAKLVNKHGKYFLHIPVTYDVEESDLSDICNVVGIDRGINFIVATYDSKHKSGFVRGRPIKQKRAHYSALRKELQMRHTPSSRRRLKRIGQRENRWMQNVNHCVSKALVVNNPAHTLFVLEDLSGIRNATERVKTKDRYVSVSWAFYDLEQKLIYKAKQNQSSVIKVNPRYTSQCCPVCGHTEKANRNKKIHLFTCKNCGYKSNDDRIGAMNLYCMGINYLYDSQVPDTVAAE